MLTVDFGNFPVMQTARLWLDRIEPKDAEDLFLLRNHPEVLTYLDRVPEKKVQEVEALIGRISQSFDQGDGITWAIRLEASGKLIGTAGIWRIDKGNHRGELGYMLLPDFWGQGIISEAIEAVLEYGWRFINLHSIEANTSTENAASHAVLRKMGFALEAHFKGNWHFNGRFLDSMIFCRLNPYH